MKPLFPLGLITNGMALGTRGDNQLAVSFNLLSYYRDTPRSQVEELLAGSFPTAVILENTGKTSTFYYNYLITTQEE